MCTFMHTKVLLRDEESSGKWRSKSIIFYSLSIYYVMDTYVADVSTYVIKFIPHSNSENRLLWSIFTDVELESQWRKMTKSVSRKSEFESQVWFFIIIRSSKHKGTVGISKDGNEALWLSVDPWTWSSRFDSLWRHMRRLWESVATFRIIVRIKVEKLC